MRIGLECKITVVEGATGSIRVELYRKGLPALSDECNFRIAAAPKPKEAERRSTLPDFEVIAVAGPDDDNWDFICADTDETDVAKHASNFMANEGKLYVYYSEAFPRFSTELRRFEQQNEAMASSFRARYEMWLGGALAADVRRNRARGSCGFARRRGRHILAAGASALGGDRRNGGVSGGDERCRVRGRRVGCWVKSGAIEIWRHLRDIDLLARFGQR